ncbi:MAG: hypothetical protein DRP97_05245 [Candidatus Latescibacterota bacterium]|nr:MAG: hypothetical protein DRP97_05245 [Candidatus Latescibacterota bacterium]
MDDQQEKTVLAPAEWSKAFWLLSMNSSIFSMTWSEDKVLRYIAHRTLRRQRFSEWFEVDEWVEGRVEGGFLGCRIERPTVRKALKALHKHKIINIVERDAKNYRYKIVLNVPGILKALAPIDDVLEADEVPEDIEIPVPIKLRSRKKRAGHQCLTQN